MAETKQQLIDYLHENVETEETVRTCNNCGDSSDLELCWYSKYDRESPVDFGSNSNVLCRSCREDLGVEDLVVGENDRVEVKQFYGIMMGGCQRNI